MSEPREPSLEGAERRRLASRRIAAEEDVRRRVARDLHDDFGQRLAGAALELKVVRQAIPEGDSRRADLDVVGGHLAALGEDLRRLSHELHPAALERRGLNDALRDLCSDVERRGQIRVRLTVRETKTLLAEEVALGLYRIAQEALGNVLRHAQASAVHVTLTVGDEEVQLAIADDGMGFDPQASRAARGLGLASFEERAASLGGHCRIASAPGAGTEIEVTVPLPEPPSARERDLGTGPLPRNLGPYRLLDEIGFGSLSKVYLAQEPEPLSRKVAIKLHRSPLPGNLDSIRFKAEQQLLARLHHPAIAEIYEARTTTEGDPYTVMEYVPGLPITRYSAAKVLDLDARLALFAQVCGGVQYAHQKGILHRALTPSNLRVVEDAGFALPKILGFSVAPERGVRAEGAEASAERAPETLRSGEIDARSEVYALGAVLRELCLEVPPKRRWHRGDLDLVVAKATAEEPSARYPTVEAFGREVERLLAGEPVEDEMPGARSRLRRFVRRHTRFATALSVAVLLLIGGWIASAREARRAAAEAERAEVVARFLEELFQAADPRAAKGSPPDLRDLLRRGTERISPALRDQPLLRARLLDSLGGIHTELGLYDQARPLLSEALAIRERLSGPESAEVAVTLVRLGSLAHLSGSGDAVATFERALAIRERTLGAETPEVAEVLNKLGVGFAARGDLAAAERTLRRSLALSERLWGPGDPRVAKVLHNLGGVVLYGKAAADAAPLLERALAIRERTLPADDLELAGSREALAVLRLGQRRPQDALPLFERQMATAEKVYGAHHVEYARPLLNLAISHRDLGHDALATQLFERALKILDERVTSDHPMVVHALARLGDHHAAHARLSEAEPYYRRLAELAKAGAVSAQWNDSLFRYADLLRATGRAAAAEALAASRALPHAQQ